MSNVFQDDSGMLEDDVADDYSYELENTPSVADDNASQVNLHRHVEHMLDTITRIGGEVCRLRAEVDGLLDQNATLLSTFTRLRDVIDERGLIDVDDFELACDVMEDIQGEHKNFRQNYFRKVSH